MILGFLSLLSIGFVAMAMGGGDEDDLDQVDDGQDEQIPTDTDIDGADFLDAVSASSDDPGADQAQEYDNTTRNALIQEYVPIGEVDEETDAQIADFLDRLDPGQPIDEAADAYRAFVTGLGIEVLSLETTPDEAPEAPAELDEPEEAQEYKTTTRDNLIRDYVPIGEVDSETSAQIADFLEGLDTALPINEAAAAYRAFVTELGVETFGGGEGEDGTDDDVTRPPMGEQFRDPLTIEQEQVGQPIVDETPGEEGTDPANLVTVSDAENAEVEDSLILSARADDTPEDDPDFTVTAPDGPNSISVGYDATQTFLIQYNADTSSVSAGLNSQIEGPEGTINSEYTSDVDANGVAYTQYALTKTFDNSTQIDINVTDEQIGAHIAQIDLENPNDQLVFNFDGDVSGNLHLIFKETERGDLEDSSVVMHAYVVRTDADVTSISQSDLENVLNAEPGTVEGYDIVSEIFLGKDSLFVNGGGDASSPYQLIIDTFMNDNPQISANVEWASVSSHDDTPVQSGGTGTGTGTGMTTGGSGNTGGSPGEILANAGINPAFFGF